MQGSGSGAISVRLHRAKVSFGLIFEKTSDGSMDIDKFFITESVLFCGRKLVRIGRDLLSCFSSGNIFKEG